MRLKSLTYVSQAAPDLSERDLVEIHEAARHLNALDGVTGLLVFDGKRFLQIIEGAEEAIDDLTGRLRRDQRHSGLEIRDERLIDDRSFPDWSMELLKVDAGYTNAPHEMAAFLPKTATPAISELAMRMTAELSASS